MSSEEFKKKEKGKEIVTFEESPGSSVHHFDHIDEEVPMFLNEHKVVVLLQANKKTCREKTKLNQFKNDNPHKVDNQETHSSSSKITPFIFYTSDEKARLRWTSDLHDCFVNAVTKLGGPDKATPKSVKEIMEVEGIALHHVKSRLQKFRLGKCNIRDGTSQSNKRFRSITKTFGTSHSPRPQVNIKPKVMESVKPKKAKEIQGSLYMRIKHDLQRRQEAHRMQMALAIENQHNIFETQYVEPGHGQFNDNHNYTVAQGFINPYMNIEPQAMHDSFDVTTQQQLQLNGECVIENSHHNATCLSSTILPTMDYIHQGTSSNSVPLLATPQSIQAYISHQMYSYPPYITLELVKAKLDALQNSNTSQVQETHYHETNLPPSCEDVDPVDMYIDWDKVEENDIELDPVDMYIDWDKVEENDIEPDPVEVLLALGFGVSP